MLTVSLFWKISGGWCQVAVKNMPVGGLVIGVDLLPIKPVRGVKTLIGDITTQQCRHMIRKETGGALIDVVLCDGAPNVGGAWSSEAYTQSELVLEAARMASDILAPNGTFVTKVFRSKDYSALIFALKQLFRKVEATKPAASRNASAEIFVVCLGYKAPSKIDPRLFEAKHIFRDFDDAPKIEGPDALLRSKDKQRRFREGYEEGISTTHKELSAVDFVQSESPVEMLGKYTTISFSPKNTSGMNFGWLFDLFLLCFLKGRCGALYMHTHIVFRWDDAKKSNSTGLTRQIALSVDIKKSLLSNDHLHFHMGLLYHIVELA